MEKQGRNIIKFALLAIPSVLLGMFAMVVTGVSPMIWGQNFVIMLVGALLSLFLMTKSRRLSYEAVIAISSILLLMTLLTDGMNGVHRWINLSIVNVNVAFIVIPLVLISIDHLLKVKKHIIALLLIVFIGFILFIQPDASQLSGFTIPIIVILFKSEISRQGKCIVSIALIWASIMCWLNIDELQPVSYVEDILMILNNISPLLLIMGIASLLLIPLPFIFFPPIEFRYLSICIGLYYAITVISTAFGNFPVPIMGYGISPIIGYWTAFIWYARTKLLDKIII